jgi:hypothetical protein
LHRSFARVDGPAPYRARPLGWKRADRDSLRMTFA